MTFFDFLLGVTPRTHQNNVYIVDLGNFYRVECDFRFIISGRSTHRSIFFSSTTERVLPDDAPSQLKEFQGLTAIEAYRKRREQYHSADPFTKILGQPTKETTKILTREEAIEVAEKLAADYLKDAEEATYHFLTNEEYQKMAIQRNQVHYRL